MERRQTRSVGAVNRVAGESVEESGDSKKIGEDNNDVEEKADNNDERTIDVVVEILRDEGIATVDGCKPPRMSINTATLLHCG